MHPLNRQIVLSRTKADLTRGKGCLLRSTNLLVSRWPGAESGALLEEFVEITTQTEWDPSGCSKLMLKVTDLASLLFNLRLNRQEFGTTFADKRETTHVHYECQGTWHYASKCPAREKRRGKTKNSPGKSNPSKISLLQGDRLNPGY
jgi:hypothetical protein